jgi:hypothetical protein
MRVAKRKRPAFALREDLMVARAHTDSRFVVAFWRDGEMHDSRTAATGERALAIALRMLAELDALQDGDNLDVVEG